MRALLRSKGFFWLATRHHMGINWSFAGHVARVHPAGNWLAAVSPERRPQTPDIADYVATYWQEPFGDRRQELVFIGMNMPKDDMLRQLNAALLTDDELALGETGWKLFIDDFPQWQQSA